MVVVRFAEGDGESPMGVIMVVERGGGGLCGLGKVVVVGGGMACWSVRGP